MQLSPVEYVIRSFGGVRATARALNLSPGAVSHWQRKKHIPTQHTLTILEKAKELQIDIKPTDLILGREIPMQEF